MSAPTTIVTGGAGFIGSHLVRLLLEQGQRIRVIERPGASIDHLPLAEIDVAWADIRDREALVKTMAGAGEVYHLAANPQLWAQPRGIFTQVNYHGAVNVIETALAAGATRVLHTSTESILTRAHKNGAITEDEEVPIADVLAPYCRSKFLGERFALAVGRAGAPVIVVNPTVPIGPGDRMMSPPTRMILGFCRGKRREYVDGTLNLIDVRDVARGMVLAMNRGRPGRRYLLGYENRSIRDVFCMLAKLMNLPEPGRRIPYPVAMTVAYLSEWWADVVTHRPPAATVTGVKLARRAASFDPHRSLDELGLSPRAIEGSLADAIAWMRDSGWLPYRPRGFG
jgi:dihydroflavonol-4-reductase